jgi:hypothetical protein
MCLAIAAVVISLGFGTGKRHDGLDSYGTTFIGRQMLWMGVHEHSL